MLAFDYLECPNMGSAEPDDKSCTPQLFPFGQPNPEWLPEQLIAFVLAQYRVILNSERVLSAEYWRFGTALEVLRTTFDHGQWEQFLKNSQIDKSKASRARAIARTFAKEEDLANLTVQQAYERRDRKQRRPAAASQTPQQTEPGRFEKFLVHVSKVAEPFINDAGFAEPNEAAVLLPTLDQVLAKFTRIRALLREQIAKK
jgi:hypothetical protein